MTVSIDARVGSKMAFAIAVPKEDIEILNFRNYVLTVEGKNFTSQNSEDKKLVLKISRDGVLHIDLISSGTKPVEDFSLIDARIAVGYKRYFKTSAAKAIRGVTGTYLYYKNDEDDYLAYAVGPSGKAYRIHLGRITDKNSKVRKVLDKVPEGSFHKAYFNDRLPSIIVENRQPIKAALDVLEKEGYVKKTGMRVGISEEYERTSKSSPSVKRSKGDN